MPRTPSSVRPLGAQGLTPLAILCLCAGCFPTCHSNVPPIPMVAADGAGAAVVAFLMGQSAGCAVRAAGAGGRQPAMAEGRGEDLSLTGDRREGAGYEARGLAVENIGNPCPYHQPGWGHEA